MASGSAVVIDAHAAEQGLKEVMRRIGNAVEIELRSSGSEITRSMRGGIRNVSGQTAGSIKLKSGRDAKGPFVEVSVHGAAAALEFGAKGPGARVMRPRPFLRPSLYRAIKTFRPKI